MSLADYAAVRSPAPDVPRGFEPQVEYDGDARTGSAKNVAAPEGANDRELLVGAGLDPDSYVITGGRKHRRWQMMGEWQHYHAFNYGLRTEDADEERAADIEELKKLFRRKPATRKDTGPASDAFNVVASDWQIGKGEGGGTEATIERIRAGIQDAKRHLKELRRAGYRMPVGTLLGTGDLHEGCTGFYPMQAFQVDLDRRGQNKVVRRLVREAIEELAPEFDEFIVATVGGNHGENRLDGKAFTSFADNDDVAAFEVVEEVVVDRPGFDHVRFVVPDDELAICLDINDVKIGLAHGHQFGKGGSTAQKKAENWWAYQAFGFQPLAKAQILVTGHYHHYSAVTYGRRTHIQAPSMDGGSLWFKGQTGVDGPPGMLVFRTDSTHPLGFDHARIL